MEWQRGCSSTHLQLGQALHEALPWWVQAEQLLYGDKRWGSQGLAFGKALHSVSLLGGGFVAESTARSCPPGAEGGWPLANRSSPAILCLCFSCSLDPCCYRFQMTNKGRRTHLLYWTTEGGTTLQQCNHLPPISNTKGKVSCCGPVFTLQPLRTELMPGQTAEMVLEGSCRTPQVRSPSGHFCSPLTFA